MQQSTTAISLNEQIKKENGMQVRNLLLTLYQRLTPGTYSESLFLFTTKEEYHAMGDLSTNLDFVDNYNSIVFDLNKPNTKGYSGQQQPGPYRDMTRLIIKAIKNQMQLYTQSNIIYSHVETQPLTEAPRPRKDKTREPRKIFISDIEKYLQSGSNQHTNQFTQNSQYDRNQNFNQHCDGPHRETFYNVKFKTALCRNYERFGECKVGQKCQFAHGKQELRDVQPRHNLSQNFGVQQSQSNGLYSEEEIKGKQDSTSPSENGGSEVSSDGGESCPLSEQDYQEEDKEQEQEEDIDIDQHNYQQFQLYDWSSINEKFSCRGQEITSVEKIQNQKSLKSNPDPQNYAGPGQELNENLKCGICQMVAWDPVQCEKIDGRGCEAMFCRSCIGDVSTLTTLQGKIQSMMDNPTNNCVYKQKDGICATCEKRFPSTDLKLNRILRQLYEELLFKCEVCRQTYKYADHSDHMTECLERYALGASCIFTDDCNATFKSIDQLKAHLELDCLFVTVKCKICETNLLRKDQDKHNCGQKLAHKLRKLQKQKNEQDSDFYSFRQDTNKFKQQLAKAFLEAETHLKASKMVVNNVEQNVLMNKFEHTFCTVLQQLIHPVKYMPGHYIKQKVNQSECDEQSPLRWSYPRRNLLVSRRTQFQDKEIEGNVINRTSFGTGIQLQQQQSSTPAAMVTPCFETPAGDGSNEI